MKVPFDRPIPWDFMPYPMFPPGWDAPDPCGCGDCDDCWWDSLEQHPDFPDGPVSLPIETPTEEQG